MGVVDDGEVVVLATLPDGPIVVLDKMAAQVWRLALSEPDAVSAVAEACAAQVDEIRADVEGFIESLLARGLMEATAAAR